MAYFHDGTELFCDPVVAWAVAEVWVSTGRPHPDSFRRETPPSHRAVVGLYVSELGPEVAEEIGNFVGYCRVGESPERQPWWPPPQLAAALESKPMAKASTPKERAA